MSEEPQLFKSLLTLPICSESNLGDVITTIDKIIIRLLAEPENEDKVKIFTEFLTYLTINIKKVKSIPIIYKMVIQHCRIIQRDNPDNKEFQEQCEAFLAL